MKKHIISIFTFLFLFLSFTSCDPDIFNTVNEKNVEFLALYVPHSTKILGDEKKIVKITIKNGEVSYSTFSDAYPSDSRFIAQSDLRNDIFTLGLDWRDFDYQGMYQKIDETDFHYLPMVTEQNENRYSYFKTNTATLSDNGYILYLTGTAHKAYGSPYHDYMIRFNTSDDSYEVAESPDIFALSQPEKTDDTETASFEEVFISADGKIAYGYLEAWGVNGGTNHYDYDILFSYNFDTKKYKRLGSTDDNSVSIGGMTYDRKRILYYNHHKLKMLNLKTGEITFVADNINLVNVKKNSWGNRGACVGTNNKLYIKDFISDKEYTVCELSGWGEVENTIFSKDGQHIYFTIDNGDHKYLCVTDDVEEKASYDTLGVYPREFSDLMLIK